MIPQDDLPAPPANADRKCRITWNPNTWPNWLIVTFFVTLVLIAAAIH